MLDLSYSNEKKILNTKSIVEYLKNLILIEGFRYILELKFEYFLVRNFKLTKYQSNLASFKSLLKSPMTQLMSCNVKVYTNKKKNFKIKNLTHFLNVLYSVIFSIYRAFYLNLYLKLNTIFRKQHIYWITNGNKNTLLSKYVRKNFIFRYDNSLLLGFTGGIYNSWNIKFKIFQCLNYLFQLTFKIKTINLFNKLLYNNCALITRSPVSILTEFNLIKVRDIYSSMKILAKLKKKIFKLNLKNFNFFKFFFKFKKKLITLIYKSYKLKEFIFKLKQNFKSSYLNILVKKLKHKSFKNI